MRTQRCWQWIKLDLSFTSALIWILIANAPSAHALGKNPPDSDPEAEESSEERRQLIRRAQVWIPSDVRSKNLLNGPEGQGSFAFEERVECAWVPSKRTGTTSKFRCQRPSGDVMKVRYGEENGEVFGQPLATRLFWALGFGANRVYPVRVLCHHCTEDPWSDPHKSSRSVLFDPAVVEKSFAAIELHDPGQEDQGWSWQELDQVDEAAGGAPRAHLDALKLLAAFVQHGDSVAHQQKLVCLDAAPRNPTMELNCTTPFLYVHDLGATFGSGEATDERASVDLQEWKKHRVWKSSSGCIANLSPDPDGTLRDPLISEKGRAFLSRLLGQLSDDQINDLFRVGRVELRNPESSSLLERSASQIEEWVRLFKDKRAQIAERRCNG